MIVLLAGIWLGGHPSGLPSLLRGGFFESHRSEPVTDQALGILTTRYYRELSRSSLVDYGLTGMVASLDDPYSHYIAPRSIESPCRTRAHRRSASGSTRLPSQAGCEW